MKRIISNRWIFWILLFYIFLAALHFQIDPGEFGYTDDLTFLNTSRTKTVFTWVSDLYNTWGGRITVDTAFYYVFNPSFGVVIWRLVNPLIFLLLFYTLARYAVRERDRQTLSLFTILAASLVVLISGSILIELSFWITGSISYLWPVTLGLYSLLPLWRRVLFEEETRVNLSHFLAGIFALNGLEQMALFITTLAIILLVILYIKKKPLPRSLIVLLAVFIVSSLVLFVAPGNQGRFNASVINYFPGFDHFSLLEKLLIGIEFLFISILSFNRIILVLFMSVLLAVMIKEVITKQDKFAFVFGVYLLFGLSLLVFSYEASLGKHLSYWFFNFDNLIQYDRELANAFILMNGRFFISIFSMLFWGVLLFIGVPLAIFRLQQKKPIEYILYLCVYFGAFATLFMMIASPSIYASGYRVRFPYTILLILCLLLLIKFAIPQNQTFQVGRLFAIVPVLAFGLYGLNFDEYTISKTSNIAGFVGSNDSHCSVDIISKSAYMVTINGWAYIEGYSANQDTKYLLLHSGERSFTFTTNRVVREDVTKAFGNGQNYDQSGFNATALLQDLPKGTYRIGVGIWNKAENIKKACYLEQVLEKK